MEMRLRPPGVRSSGYRAEIEYTPLGGGMLTEIGVAPGSVVRAIAIARSGPMGAPAGVSLNGGTRAYIATGAVPVAVYTSGINASSNPIARPVRFGSPPDGNDQMPEGL